MQGGFRDEYKSLFRSTTPKPAAAAAPQPRSQHHDVAKGLGEGLHRALVVLERVPALHERLELLLDLGVKGIRLRLEFNFG